MSHFGIFSACIMTSSADGKQGYPITIEFVTNTVADWAWDKPKENLLPPQRLHCSSTMFVTCPPTPMEIEVSLDDQTVEIAANPVATVSVTSVETTVSVITSSI